METLLRRDIKDLYAKAMKGEISNVVGVDIDFPEPSNPELIIENDVERTDFDELIDNIINITSVREAIKCK